MKLEKFIRDLQSKKPYPGGGSAAALTGVLSASLTIMAANISDLKELKKETQKVKKKLEKLIDKDAEAYQKVLEAYRTKDKKQINKALKYATEIPMKIAKESYNAMELAEKVYDQGKKSTATDLYTAVGLARAAVESSLIVAELNLRTLKDKEYENKIRPKKANLSSIVMHKETQIHVKMASYIYSK